MAAVVAKKYQDELEDLKKKVEDFYLYFKDNINRYHATRRFILKSNLGQNEIDKLRQLNKPIIEANTLDAYLSKQCGEFAKQEPSFEVSQDPEAQQPVSPQVIEITEGHLRAILDQANKNMFEYRTFHEQMSGGFSYMKLWTEYANDKSFNQKICIGKVFDPTLCGFDPLAQEAAKADGNYMFEIFPKSRDDFEEDFPGVDLENIKCMPKIKEFSWSYKDGKNDIILVCNLYKKKKKRVKIFELAGGGSVTEEEYEELKMQYQKTTIAQPPAIINQRFAPTTIICRYIFIENQVIDYQETNYSYLPMAFVDGNSFMLKDEGDSAKVSQFTRPYLYNALDAQRAKNLAFQTQVNEIEMLVTHKFKVAKESIPIEYAEAYKDVQKASTLVYNAFTAAGAPIPPPEEVVRIPTPPEVMNMFMGLDQTIQACLGSYDSTIGRINNNDISGEAIFMSAISSNAVAMPYIVNYLAALNHMATAIIDLIPKYLIKPRTIPIVTKEGKKSYARVNSQGAPNLNFQASDLGVEVKAGVNFEVQKNRALQTLSQLGQSFPAIGQMLNSKGLPVIFDNLDIRGADILKDMAEQFTQEMQQVQQQQKQDMLSGKTPNPAQIEQQKNQIKMAELQQKEQHKAADIALEQQKMQQTDMHKSLETQLQQQKIDNERVETQMQFLTDRIEMLVQFAKANAENRKDSTELAMKAHDQLHQHAKDTIELHHKITQPTTTGANANE